MENHAWEASRPVIQGEADEDLEEFEGVVEALSKLDSVTTREGNQSRTSHGKLRTIPTKTRLMSNAASEEGSSVSSSSSPWASIHGSTRRWQKIHGDPELPEEMQLELGTAGSIHEGQDDALLSVEAGSSNHKQLAKLVADDDSLAPYEENFGKIFGAEEALRQRVEDLEEKVNLLLAEDYFHRVSIPNGCFVIVLPGPSYAHKFTEDLVESLQVRLESIWPLCYFAPIVAKLANLATAILSWLPLPSVVYTCNFPPQLECQTSNYDIGKLGL